jgi:hypothetical protein
MARYECSSTVSCRAYFGSARVVQEAHMNPLIFPSAIILQSSLYSQLLAYGIPTNQRSENGRGFEEALQPLKARLSHH